MSKKFKIFRNYGVLAAEKRNVYTYGGANPLSDYAEEIKILVQDGCTEKEAEKHLASGAVVLEEEDFRIFFSDYMKGWEIEGGDQQPYREMLENKIPLPDWGVVEYDGKTYFIAYVL